MVQGHLSSKWSGRLGDMEMLLSPQISTSKRTILQGYITDQAELAGILKGADSNSLITDRAFRPKPGALHNGYIHNMHLVLTFI
jgi:hypothetical protein